MNTHDKQGGRARIKVQNAIAGASVLLALSACANGAVPATTTHAPAAWTVREAGQHFLALTAPRDDVITKFGAAVLQHKPLPTFITLSGELAAAESTEIAGLSKGHWPAVARSGIAELIAAVRLDRSSAVRASHVHSQSAYDAARTTGRSDIAGIEAYNSVARALGLR